MKEISLQNDLNEHVWRWIVILGIGCVVATLLVNVAGRGTALTQWVALLMAGPAWYAAVRLLLLKTRMRMFWIVWLALAVVALLLIGDRDGRFVVALIVSIAFLTFRLYRPYRLLTSQRRIVLGLMSLFFIVFLPGEIGFRAEAGRILNFVHAVGIYALWSLKVFFGFTLVHLFLGMRLHFLRLKPKLMVTAFFLAVVPLVLLAVFSIISTVNLLERDRAGIAARILETDAMHLVRGTITGEAEQFVAEKQGEELLVTGTASPVWLSSFLRAIDPDSAAIDTSTSTTDPTGRITISQPGDEGGTVITVGSKSDTLSGIKWTPADTTMLFQTGPELWVVDVRGIGEPILHLRGYRVDEAVLDDVAIQVDSNLLLQNPGGSDKESLYIYGFRNPEERAVTPPDSSVGIHLGIALLSILTINGGHLETNALVLLAKTPPLQLLQDLTSGQNTMNQALIVLLVAIAIIFLVIELGALFLGIRITRGFTSAVGVLHAGTRRLAEGDLETRIEIENQDEFGDLAESFNEMTVAVQKGHEEAIARERLEKELETARNIQERLLPDDMPDVPGYEFAATNISSLQVGGDYFDFVETGTGQTGVVIADVSGKGIPAALLMANLQAALQGQAIHPGNVAAITGRVNDLLSRSSDVHMYATFFYGVLDRKSGRFTYCNAGHNPPIVQRANGSQEFLEVGGIVVGMMTGIAYEEDTIKIGPGDTIVMYTDGVSEAVGPDEEAIPDGAVLPDGEAVTGPEDKGVEPVPAVAVEIDEDEDEDEEPEENMFGEERLYEILTRTIGQDVIQIRDTILREVTEFGAGMPQSDDITVVVLRRLPETS